MNLRGGSGGVPISGRSGLWMWIALGEKSSLAHSIVGKKVITFGSIKKNPRRDPRLLRKRELDGLGIRQRNSKTNRKDVRADRCIEKKR